MKRLTLRLVALPLVAHAGGSNYGITPGAHPESGRQGERVAGAHAALRARSGRRARRKHLHRGDERQQGRPVRSQDQSFKEWDLPPGHHPHGLLVDRQGMVWTTGTATARSGDSIRRTAG
jgi:virginiamycin B lyase